VRGARARAHSTRTWLPSYLIARPLADGIRVPHHRRRDLNVNRPRLVSAGFGNCLYSLRPGYTTELQLSSCNSFYVYRSNCAETLFMLETTFFQGKQAHPVLIGHTTCGNSKSKPGGYNLRSCNRPQPLRLQLRNGSV